MVVVASASSIAHAHGRPVLTGQIAFHPSDEEFILVRGTFGHLLTSDGGETWSWICRDVIDAGLYDDPRIAVMSDGALLSASFNGLLRGTDGGCTWAYPDAAFENTVVIDGVRHPTDPASAFVVTSPGGAPNRLFVSGDDGETWSSPSAEIAPVPYLAERVVVAASDPDRIYVSGAIPPGVDSPRMPLVYVSSDGGETWAGHGFPTEEGDRNIYVLAADPTDADRAFMRVSHDADLSDRDRLVRTDDAGQNWTEVLTAPQITDAVISDDGMIVWVATPDEGLLESNDGGLTFSLRNDTLRFGCLARRGDELWACTDGFTDDGVAIARSTDGGETFEPVLEFDDFQEPLECPAPSELTATCEAVYSDLEIDLGRIADAGMSTVDSGIDSADAGSTDPSPPAGCDCSADGGEMRWSPILAGLGLLWLRRRCHRGW